jgi:hypothetical protein
MESRLRRVSLGILCVVTSLTVHAVSHGATTGAQAARLAPTPLEAMAAQPDAKTRWSKWIGRLDGRRAYATVSAVVIESPTFTPRTLRGIRIDLRHEGLRPSCTLSHVEWAVMCDREQAAAFVEEDRLAAFIAAVPGMSAELHPGHPSSIVPFSSVQGSGLLLGGYHLYGRTLGELAALLEAASTELKSAPVAAQ